MAGATPTADPSAPRIIVHSKRHAEIALAAAAEFDVAVILESPPEGVHSLGAPYFSEMIALARASVPGAKGVAMLDCGSSPGMALAALRLGVEAVRLAVDDDVFAGVADIAAQMGKRAEPDAPDELTLDLATARDPVAAAREFIIEAYHLNQDSPE